MSELQYYEFRAIDCPLDKKAMNELRSLTSRAEITSTSLINEYHFGDFRGDPLKLMEKYFDAFLYYANWGTHRLMFRLPRRLVDVAAFQAYGADENLEIHVKADHVIVEFSSQDEDGEWEDDYTEWLASLIPLRQDLMAGDLRSLYLGWLAYAQLSEEDDEDLDREPPVPPGMKALSGPLESLVHFLRIDEDILEVAARTSIDAAPKAASQEELQAWLASLPTRDKDDWLLRLLQGEGGLLAAELHRRFLHERKKGVGEQPVSKTKRRTVAQLVAARAEATAIREQKEAEQRQRKLAAFEAQQAKERAAYLDALSLREPAAWKEIDEWIATKSPKNYDQAVKQLNDLVQIAERAGRAEETAERILALSRQHAKKMTLMERFIKAGLPR